MRKSKVILLSTVCFCAYTGDLSYASYGASFSIHKSGIHTYYNTPHNATDNSPLLSSAQFQKSKAKDSMPDLDSRIKSEHDILLHDKDNLGHKEASVCFITDAGNCSGETFGKTETPGSGNGAPDYESNDKLCIAAGYTVTSCPEGTHGEKACPADSSYFQECSCDANMTETCTKPYYGEGTPCNGKYASCARDDAKACSEDGYTETSCPSGYSVESTCSYNDSYKKCKGDACSGYYECGGAYQYCTGATCPSDSSKCSVFCVSDYFPYSCSSSSTCSAYGGIYRNGYCSKSCGSSGSSSSGSSSDSSSGSSVSECENPGCDANAYCSRNRCYCNTGYTGSGTSCRVDPCYGVTCGANAYCSSGACKCNYGYSGDPNTGCSVPRTRVVSSCSRALSAGCYSYSGSKPYAAQFCAEKEYECVWNDGYHEPVGNFTCLSARYFATMEECEAEAPSILRANYSSGFPTSWWCNPEGSYDSVPCGGR